MNRNIDKKTRSIAYVEFRVMCHNERATIIEVVERSLSALSGTPWQLCVEVIDDGSDDGSDEVVRDAFGDHASVTVTSFGEHRGLGAVLRRAFRPTEADAVVLLCSDLQFAPEDTVPLIEALDDSDLVFALRPKRADSVLRKAISTTESALMRLLLGQTWLDVHWVRGVRGWLLDGCSFRSNSPIVDQELAMHAVAERARLTSLPLPHYARRSGRAQGASMRNVLRSTFDLATLACRRGARVG